MRIDNLKLITVQTSRLAYNDLPWKNIVDAFSLGKRLASFDDLEVYQHSLVTTNRWLIVGKQKPTKYHLAWIHEQNISVSKWFTILATK